jgi:cell wall-associated NlpC family hydrolase
LRDFVGEIDQDQLLVWRRLLHTLEPYVRNALGMSSVHVTSVYGPWSKAYACRQTDCNNLTIRSWQKMGGFTCGRGSIDQQWRWRPASH